MNTISYYRYLLFSFLFIQNSPVESSQINNSYSATLVKRNFGSSFLKCDSDRQQTSCFQNTSGSGVNINVYLPSHGRYNDNTKFSNHKYVPLSSIYNQIQNNANRQRSQSNNMFSQRMRPLNMALLPIPVESLETILTSKLPTSAQYASYWGRTSREQYNAGFEAFGVSFLGVFASYFLSFAIGQFVATIMGMIAGSWLILGPELKAYQRNWELTSGRDLVDPWIEEDDDIYEFDEDKRGLYGAFYLGRIEHVCVVDYPSDPPKDEYSLNEFQDYTMEQDEQERETGIPYSLRLRVTDATPFDEGRELQIHTRMSEEYLDLKKGMPVCSVLLSTSQRFQDLAAITDFCVPDAGPCWVGDYPYLDRPALEEMFVKDDYLWDTLRDEGRGKWDMNE